MFRFSSTELIIILVIIILLFGAGRIGRIAGEIGSAIRNFREAAKSDEDKKNSPLMK